MKCCADCFGDRGLRRSIIPLRSDEVGTCSYCTTNPALVLEPAQLAEYFELLISAYQPNRDGMLLVECFRRDWGMFMHPRMDDPRAKDLLAEILNDGQIVRQTFSPSGAPQADRLGEWEKLRDELMYRNRFFPDANIDLDRLAQLLSHLTPDALEVPKTWYRARIQLGDTKFAPAQMGAPPARLASHGRANPAGIPYLYLASNAETSISEVRPHTGEIASVAEFRALQELKLVDLRSPRTMVSPFLLEDAADIARMRADLPFLERLGQELTRAVLPHSAAIDYTPSQYLCEFIKNCGYDGVLYRSSLSDGMNLALFGPSKAECREIASYRVERVTIEAARE
jgi:hypothetical protein